MCDTKEKPVLHSQLNEPTVFLQSELDGHALPSAHSSISSQMFRVTSSLWPG